MTKSDMKMLYTDRNGNEIKAGMKIAYDDNNGKGAKEVHTLNTGNLGIVCNRNGKYYGLNNLANAMGKLIRWEILNEKGGIADAVR